MARLWSVVLVLALSAAYVSARDLQQAAGDAQPTVLAAKQNNNIPQQGSSSNINAQRAISNTNTGAVTATTIQPQSSERHTLDQVNAAAPTITDPSTHVSVRPVASSQVVGQNAAAPAGAATYSSATAQPAASTGAGSTVSAQPAASKQIGVVNPYDVVGANPLDREVITGDFISQIVGVRIATPFFGTGFNFCIGEPPRFLRWMSHMLGWRCVMFKMLSLTWPACQGLLRPSGLQMFEGVIPWHAEPP